MVNCVCSEQEEHQETEDTRTSLTPNHGRHTKVPGSQEPNYQCLCHVMYALSSVTDTARRKLLADA